MENVQIIPSHKCKSRIVSSNYYYTNLLANNPGKNLTPIFDNAWY